MGDTRAAQRSRGRTSDTEWSEVADGAALRAGGAALRAGGAALRAGGAVRERALEWIEGRGLADFARAPAPAHRTLPLLLLVRTLATALRLREAPPLLLLVIELPIVLVAWVVPHGLAALEVEVVHLAVGPATKQRRRARASGGAGL